MKILALLEMAAGKTPADFSPLLVAEELAVWRSYRKGSLREMHFQRDPLVVSLVFEAPDFEAVARELEAYPLVFEGLLDVRLISLGPWLPLEKIFDSTLTKDAFDK